MAVQDFVSGGYYGKLGVTVGQRWKNIRTIRSYVVPNNPRTPIQQENRSKFGRATALSQLAMQMNYKATCFEDVSMTRWNYRMRTAKTAVDNGLSELNCIPLYPTDYSLPYYADSITASSISSSNEVSFSLTGVLPAEKRTLSVLIRFFNEDGDFIKDTLFLGEWNNENSSKLVVQLDSSDSLNANCLIRFVSRDDVDSATDLFACSQLQVAMQPIDVHSFDVSTLSVTSTQAGLSILTAEPGLENTTDNTASIDVYAVENGRFVTKTLQGTISNNNGFAQIDVVYGSPISTQKILAFPDNSYILFNSVSYKNASVQATLSNLQKPYSNADLTRTLSDFVQGTGNNAGSLEVTLYGLPDTDAHSVGQTQGRTSVCFDTDYTFTRELVAETNAESNLISIYYTGMKDQAYRNGDYITLADYSFVCNGVTYTLPTQQMAISNSLTTSYVLLMATVTKTKNYNSSTGALGDVSTQYSGIPANVDYTSEILSDYTPTAQSISTTINASYTDLILAQDGSEVDLLITAHFNNQVISGFMLATMPNTTVSVNGYDYYVPAQVIM